MSAVIYAAIVVIWLIVLVPMWLRRHDAALDERSSERFEGAMRVLARRSSKSSDRRYVVMPRRSAGTAVHVSGATAAVSRPVSVDRPLVRPAVPAAVAPMAAAKAPSSRGSVAARRRRTLIVLFALTVLAVAGTAVGPIPWPVQLLPELLLVGFVVNLRHRARRAAAVSRQRRRDAVAPQPVSLPDWTVPAAEPVVAEAAFDETFEDSVVFDEASAETISYDEPQPTEPEQDNTWEPKPVPRPTYTMKPPAPAADPLLAADDDPADEDADDGLGDLDLILEQRWAVND